MPTDAAHRIIESICIVPVERVPEKGVRGVKVERVERAILRNDVRALCGQVVQRWQGEGATDGQGGCGTSSVMCMGVRGAESCLRTAW